MLSHHHSSIYVRAENRDRDRERDYYLSVTHTIHRQDLMWLLLLLCSHFKLAFLHMTMHICSVCLCADL